MPVDRVSFACTMIRREALDQVGLLDESFLFYSEDYDWFKRLSDAAWQVLFCPKAQVLHYWARALANGAIGPCRNSTGVSASIFASTMAGRLKPCYGQVWQFGLRRSRYWR